MEFLLELQSFRCKCVERLLPAWWRIDCPNGTVTMPIEADQFQIGRRVQAAKADVL